MNRIDATYMHLEATAIAAFAVTRRVAEVQKQEPSSAGVAIRFKKKF